MARLQGKTALITGGTTGIGFATAKLFMQEGARVAITGQNAERVAEAGKQLGAGAIAICANVASAQEMTAVAAKLKAEFGSLDIVFANAGIAKPMPVTEVDDANIDDQINVNIKGVVYTVQKMLPLLKNPSSVILNASTLAQQGMAGMGIYSATKAAVRSLARTWSGELVGQGVRVNVISPGPIETPIYSKLGLPAQDLEQMAGQIVGQIPMARFGHADEIAKVALFLASDDSTYILGENILVDGGMANI